uniref:KIB1-4 beta-propeller domain-containing protein n=1 Tax=Hordeum vulgare subsp. vulgare TaxID=112509 RepID=A0A8I6X1F2_HORVV
MTMPAASTWSWADLNSELVVSVAATVAVDGSPLTLRDYESLRCVCAAWRSALEPPYPCLLSLADGGASVFSLPTRRSLRLNTLCEVLNHSLLSRIDRFRSKRSRYQGRVVGSANGCLAVAVDRGILEHGLDGVNTCVGWRPIGILLLDPRRGRVVAEPPLPHERVRKVVFTTDAGHGTVVAACDHGRMVYVCIGSGWGRGMKWTFSDNTDGDALADLALDAGGERLYCLDLGGAVRVLRIPRNGQDAPAVAASAPPLTRLSAVFPAPYDAASRLTITKHLFFCHGSLYQIWQKTGAAAVELGSGSTTMSADETFVLRYDPKRWPAWEAVKELGGRSVFVGQNSSPVVVRAAGVGAMPRVRADCVYWINCLGIPMVCDVATGSASEPCVTSCSGVCRGDCWYFGDENTAIEH